MSSYDLTHVRLLDFNSFKEIPEIDEGHWNKGDFNSDMAYTKKIMTEKGIDWSRTFLIKGWFDDTLNDKTQKKYEINKIS